MRLVVGVGLAAVAATVSFLLSNGYAPRSEGVLFAGCERIVSGPVCELASGDDLVVWLEGGPFDQVDVHLDGAAVETETSTLSGGTQLRVAAPSPGELAVVARDAAATRHLRLRLRAYEKVAWPDDVRADLEAGRWGDLQNWATDHPGRASVELYFRMALAVEDDPKTSLKWLATSAELARKTGEWSLEAKARYVRAYLALNTFDLEQAARELERVEPLRAKVPDVTANLPYYRGLVSVAAGDLTRALVDLRASARRARALGDERLGHIAEVEQANIELRLGYFDAAISRYRGMMQWAARNDVACDEAVAAGNLGWTLTVKRERSAGPTADPEAPLRRALRLLLVGACDEPSVLQITRLNLAYAALQAGRPDDAERWLASVEASALSARKRPWIAETEARIAMARGDLALAGARAERLIDQAEVTPGFDLQFRARVLLAEILTKDGRLKDALVARQRAEKALDRLAVSVPLVGARHSFLSVRDDNVLGLAALLIGQRRPAEALEAVRRARSRSLGWARVSQGLAQLPAERRAQWNTRLGEYRKLRQQVDTEIESYWRYSKEELRAAIARISALETRMADVLAEALTLIPAEPTDLSAEPGVLRLSWIRLADGVMVLGQLGDDAFAVPWSEQNDSMPGAVAHRLPSAEMVLLHPYGDLRGLDLHMLKYRGKPLGAHIRTAYALDLSTAQRGRPARDALIVVDPSGELAYGPEEARVVTAALRAAGAHTTVVKGDVAEVRRLLGTADWFHFGGHGKWSPEDPLAGGLALADGARFGIGDILAASEVPSTVVLTSCEAGRAAGRGGESFGLAHAFLVAGARFVVAPNREVEDTEAARFSRAFYRASGDALERYRQAVRTIGVEAAAFRVFVP